MWFEPNLYPDQQAIYGGIVFPVGFDTPPGADINSPYHVLNDHTYCCDSGAGLCPENEPYAWEAERCREFLNRKIDRR